MIVIDDFLPDFDLVKSFIADVEYGDYEMEGKHYTGVGQVTLPVKALIEKRLGPIKIKANHLRMARSDTPLTHYIHTDNYGTALGMVLCLQAPDCPSGTAFWRHKETGLDRIEMDKDVFEYFDEELKNPDAWEMTELVESAENRAVIFETNRFHSRWPKDMPIALGEKPRIVCTVFFDKL
jgi:hypothetical protein